MRDKVGASEAFHEMCAYKVLTESTSNSMVAIIFKGNSLHSRSLSVLQDVITAARATDAYTLPGRPWEKIACDFCSHNNKQHLDHL